jgi:hypothetical protein
MQIRHTAEALQLQCSSPKHTASTHSPTQKPYKHTQNKQILHTEALQPESSCPTTVRQRHLPHLTNTHTHTHHHPLPHMTNTYTHIDAPLRGTPAVILIPKTVRQHTPPSYDQHTHIHAYRCASQRHSSRNPHPQNSQAAHSHHPLRHPVAAPWNLRATTCRSAVRGEAMIEEMIGLNVDAGTTMRRKRMMMSGGCRYVSFYLFLKYLHYVSLYACVYVYRHYIQRL